MRLAEFITRDMEAILVQWEAFAATSVPAASSMDSLALRDHARQILEAVSRDLRTGQSPEAQAAKSMGLAPKIAGAPETAAQTHALLRAKSGFDINQLVAEYRALRASVLRLWTVECGPHGLHTQDITRFNEAIDQAVAESVDFFAAQVEQSRNLLLGMLGHDMRSPLQTIHVTATYLSALNAGAQVSEAAARLINSGARMQALLDDLLDFSRTRLGVGINVVPAEVDLAALFDDELKRLRATHPQHSLTLDTAGECTGAWDGRRLQQLLANLVVNATKYGAAGAPVRVTLSGDDIGVRLEVANEGPAIPPSLLAQMFEPLKRGAGHGRDGDGSLGLGLYIAREIAKAHRGDIEARSDNRETVFTVHLPRI